MFSGPLAVGEQFTFDALADVSRFRISGLTMNPFNLDDNEDVFLDSLRSLEFGFTLSEAGTVMTARAHDFSSASGSAPSSHALMLFGLILLFRPPRAQQSDSARQVRRFGRSRRPFWAPFSGQGKGGSTAGIT